MLEPEPNPDGSAVDRGDQKKQQNALSQCMNSLRVGTQLTSVRIEKGRTASCDPPFLPHRQHEPHARNLTYLEFIPERCVVVYKHYRTLLMSSKPQNSQLVGTPPVDPRPRMFTHREATFAVLDDLLPGHPVELIGHIVLPAATCDNKSSCRSVCGPIGNCYD